MTSQIDPSKPTVGAAKTADVRANFYAAKTEISELQQQIAALQTEINALKARQQFATSRLTTDPPNTNSTEFVLASIGNSFTPQSARMTISADGQLGNTQNGQPSEVQLIYGTGSLPAGGTPIASTNGQLLGGFAAMLAAKANDYTPFSLSALIEDLVIGSSYWLGVAFRSAGGTATLSQLSLVAVEVLDPIP